MTTFVVGTGRCGTFSLFTWLGNHGVDSHMETYAKRLVVYSCDKLHRRANRSVKLLADMFRRHPNGCVVDHNLSLFVEDLACMGDARFIWMIRNPWDCISSMMARKWYRRPNDIKSDDVYANNRLDAAVAGEMSIDEWKDLPMLGRCAWYWKFLNLRIEEQLARLDDDSWVRVRLEDWSNGTAQGVLRFVGADQGRIHPDLPKTNLGRRDKERPRWTDDETSLVVEVAGTALWRWYSEGKFKNPSPKEGEKTARRRKR